MFSKIEDQLLLQAANEYDLDWQKYGHSIYEFYKGLLKDYNINHNTDYPPRNYKKVKEHWVQSLDPNANRDPLTEEEKEEIYEIYKTNNRKVPWQNWGQEHGGRPGMFVMNQARSYIQNKEREEARQRYQAAGAPRRRPPPPVQSPEEEEPPEEKQSPEEEESPKEEEQSPEEEESPEEVIQGFMDQIESITNQLHKYCERMIYILTSSK